MKRGHINTRMIDVADYSKHGKDGSCPVVRKPDTQAVEDQVTAEYLKSPASKGIGED